MSRKISSAMKPDSSESGPSHLGRMIKRRKASPAMETATKTPKIAATVK